MNSAFAIILVLLLSACGGDGAAGTASGAVQVIASPAGTMQPLPAATPTPAAVSAPIPTPTPISSEVPGRDKLGINVTQANYWSGEPVYANQMKAISWLDSSTWQGIDRARISAAGYPKSVTLGKSVVAFLNPPAEAMTGNESLSRCTWRGAGNVWLGGYYKATTWGSKDGLTYIEFRWPKGGPKEQSTWFDIRESKEADPVRDIDCRLVGSDPTAVFSAQMLDFHKPFGVLRFLDWSTANVNPASVTWANRSLPSSVVQQGSDGTPIEEMIAFANANNSSPWFTVPWNADSDYHRRMAQMVHDTIPAGRPVYVEISNETWNYSFGVLYQSQKEGVERKLADNPLQAGLARYAEKITEVMPIWAEVFKDRPKDLVRVGASQSANPWIGENVLSWNNNAAAKNLDAYAVAPYFAVGSEQLGNDQAANMALVAAEAKRQATVVSAKQKALANKYKLRLIAYEGGQHQLDAGNMTRMIAMQRDPLMQAIYSNYLTDWKATSGGDLFTLYASTGTISKYGAWGIREYAGQPLTETPKLRGVLEFAKAP